VTAQSEGASEKKRWRRRRGGVIARAGVLGARPGDAFARSPLVVDSGDDYPLSKRGRVIYWSVVALIVVIGCAVVAVFAISN